AERFAAHVARLRDVEETRHHRLLVRSVDHYNQIVLPLRPIHPAQSEAAPLVLGLCLPRPFDRSADVLGALLGVLVENYIGRHRLTPFREIAMPTDSGRLQSFLLRGSTLR